MEERLPTTSIHPEGPVFCGTRKPPFVIRRSWFCGRTARDNLCAKVTPRLLRGQTFSLVENGINSWSVMWVVLQLPEGLETTASGRMPSQTREILKLMANYLPWTVPPFRKGSLGGIFYGLVRKERALVLSRRL
jgi:hypothetical protein